MKYENPEMMVVNYDVEEILTISIPRDPDCDVLGEWDY